MNALTRASAHQVATRDVVAAMADLTAAKDLIARAGDTLARSGGEWRGGRSSLTVATVRRFTKLANEVNLLAFGVENVYLDAMRAEHGKRAADVCPLYRGTADGMEVIRRFLDTLEAEGLDVAYARRIEMERELERAMLDRRAA